MDMALDMALKYLLTMNSSRQHQLFVLIALSLVLTGSSYGQQTSLNWEAIADKVTERMGLVEGESVLFVGAPGRFDPLIPLLQRRVEDAGGNYLGAVSVLGKSPDGWRTDFSRKAEGKSVKDLEEYLQDVDLGVMLPGAIPSHPPYRALQNLLNEGNGRTIHFHWEGAYDFNGNALIVNQDIDAFYEHALLNTDYEQLGSSQRAFEEDMRSSTITVTTPTGTNISFRIGNRPVTKQDGDASAKGTDDGRNLIDREIELPAGAVRVAPLEESVNGVIAFPDAVWSGELVKGLSIRIEKGIVTEVTAEENGDAASAEMNRAGVAGRSFREFALGMNPKLAIPENGEWIPYYGYGAGVVRLSLGDNTELGGNVSGGYVRWNFFINATVKVDDDVWVLDGELIK